jgi:hypothetical protein
VPIFEPAWHLSIRRLFAELTRDIEKNSQGGTGPLRCDAPFGTCRRHRRQSTRWRQTVNMGS